MTAQELGAVVNLLELLEKKKDRLPQIVVDYVSGKVVVDDRRSRLKSELKTSTDKLLNTENLVEESLQTIKAIYIFEEMQLIDKAQRTDAVNAIFSSVPESIGAKIEDKWPDMLIALNNLIKTS